MINIYSIPELITSIFFLLLGIYCYKAKPKVLYVKIFCYLCFVTFGWQFIWFILSNTPEKRYLPFLVKMSYSTIVFIPVFYYHFVISFLGINNKKERFFINLSYFVAIIFGILLWSTASFINGYYDFSWGAYAKASYLHIVYLTILMFQAFRSIFFLYVFGYKKEDISKQLKYQSRLIFYAFLIYLFAAIDFLPNYGFDFFPPGHFLAVISFFIIAYAILKHRFLDIKIVIRKSLVYTLITGIFTALYLFLVFILSNLIGNLIGSNIIITLTMIIAFAFGFQPLKDQIQQRIDKIFFKGKYDYQYTLRSLSSASVNIIDPIELIKYISYNLSSTINPTSIHILLIDQTNKTYQEKLAPYKSLPIESKTIKALNKTKQAFIVEEIENYSELKEEANLIEAYLLIPLFSKNQLIGLISLGQKKNEESYNDEDINLLSTLANHLATSIENSLLHEEALATEKKLIQADKLSSLGTMAAGMAHEIKNPLSIIKGLAKLNEEAYKNKDDEFFEQYKEIVPKELDRINNLVENLLKFSKPPKAVLTNCDLNQILKDSIQLFSHEFKKRNVELVEQMNKLPNIKADENQLQQVFSNLILNAIDAMPTGGTINIRSYQVGKEIIVEVSDSGIGIPESNLKNIFDPFFTTKSKGNGLGLAVTYKIIKEHSANIEVESVINKGTTFILRFPVQ